MYSALEVIFQVNFTNSVNYQPFQNNNNKKDSKERYCQGWLWMPETHCFFLKQAEYIIL